ncbi:MAG: PEP-CTERM sorting domain-containing protein [Hydrococcus sp. Prado102]|jgi:hypothetical protein|nr:PEP-CTERM sorting domain-containing protein [Hydrococcus sp. Prado102]
MGVKNLAVLSGLPLMAAGILGSAVAANAGTIVSGDAFNISSNVYASLNQFDFVGPPPISDPEPQTLNAPGFFTIISGTGGFTDGVFNRPQVPNPSGFIKDTREAGTTGSITQEANPADGTDAGFTVDDFITFNNLPNATPLNFSIDLVTITRLAVGNPPGPVTPTTPIGALRFDITGVLTDNLTGKKFELVGSFTPNVGAGSPFAGVDFGDFVEGDNFIGAPGATIASGEGPLPYTGSFEVGEEIVPPVPEPATVLGLIAALGLGASLKKAQHKDS